MQRCISFHNICREKSEGKLREFLREMEMRISSGKRRKIKSKRCTVEYSRKGRGKTRAFVESICFFPTSPTISHKICKPLFCLFYVHVSLVEHETSVIGKSLSLPLHSFSRTSQQKRQHFDWCLNPADSHLIKKGESTFFCPYFRKRNKKGLSHHHEARR